MDGDGAEIRHHRRDLRIPREIYDLMLIMNTRFILTLLALFDGQNLRFCLCVVTFILFADILWYLWLPFFVYFTTFSPLLATPFYILGCASFSPQLAIVSWICPYRDYQSIVHHQ